MAHVLVQHSVEDYGKWRALFDEHESTRQQYGGGQHHVFQDASDPNKLTILMEWDTLDNARRFTESDDLRSAMMQAGVIGRPETHFLNEA